MALTDPNNRMNKQGGVTIANTKAMEKSGFNGNRIADFVPTTNPGQIPGSGMHGAGNVVPSGVPKNEGCIDPGERRFSI